ncbi:MAG: ABC-F family ATP-binding cassette domain-containing protein [Lachnospiraceae bacterium]|nr:ABC-F family ATP-binding cassette domain-containing protein [Lachnospiraceae bacterium]
MLQIQNLTLTHRRDLRVLLRDFSLVLQPGDKAVIIGEEGNGKSTLLKWIYDPGLIDGYIEAEGTRTDQGEKLGYLPQELPKEAREKKVYEYFSQMDCFYNSSPQEQQRLAARLRLPGDVFYGNQRMGTLSGGERIKLQLAGLLLEQPDILLLDEPSNDLDLETLEWLEEFICSTSQTVLFISHDETLLERTANRVILLEQLRRKTVCRYTVANLPFRSFMEERSAAFEKQARLAAGERREEKRAQERFQRIQQRVEHEQNAITRQDPHGGRLLKKKMASVKALEKRYAREHEEMTEYPEEESAITIRFDRQLAMPAGKRVLKYRNPQLVCRSGETDGESPRLLSRDVELTVQGPEKICIVGRNGTGKTTMLREIWEQLRERQDIHACYMPQDYDELLELDLTPVEYLAGSGRKEDITLARTYLGAMKYTAEEMHHPMRALSGGQRAKLLLLSMSLSKADVLILDEPTRNFSPLSAPRIRKLLQDFSGAIISVSHDRKYMEQVCDKIYELGEDGLHMRW